MEHAQQKARRSPVKRAQQGDFENQAVQPTNTNILALQRTIGNQATMQHLRRQTADTPSQPAHAHKPALGLPPLDLSDETVDSYAPKAVLQRQIAPIAGASSGWFRKGRRDKLNALVGLYNGLDARVSALRTPPASSVQMLMTWIEKVLIAANAWHDAIVKKSPDKAASIRQWIIENVETERIAKQARIGDLQATETLKAASDAASYNELYATPEYTVDAGTRWLATPAIAPIFEYFMKTQREDLPLQAYKEIKKYSLNPTRDEAIRIYRKYEMHDKKLLNITGESAGGIGAIEAIRAQINALVSDASAPVPATFGAIEASLISVINMIFTTFASTEPFRKVTTPPRP